MTHAPWLPSTPTGLLAQELIPHPLRRHVKTVGVQMPHRHRPLPGRHEQKHSMNFWTGQGKRGEKKTNRTKLDGFGQVRWTGLVSCDVP